MVDTYNRLLDQLEHVDASVFSGELLWNANERALLKEYAERWLRAIAEHEQLLANSPKEDTDAPDDPPAVPDTSPAVPDMLDPAEDTTPRKPLGRFRCHDCGNDKIAAWVKTCPRCGATLQS